nr:hypothetical protein [Burkholderia ambifaria]
MATMKQAAANRQNARKSTGPATAQGKAKASVNALKHGITSARLFLNDENPEEFQLLLDELQASLRPNGGLEFMLVERIAVSIWRQRRLVRAETAGLELNRRLETKSNRRLIETAMGMAYPNQIEDGDVNSSAESEQADAEYFSFCETIVDEYHNLDRKSLEANEVARLAQAAPALHAALLEEAAGAHVAVTQYVQTLEKGLLGWVNKTVDMCYAEMEQIRRRAAIIEVASFVRSRQSAPIDQELLHKYQTNLDNELYRATRALREVQEWRLKTLNEVGAIEAV